MYRGRIEKIFLVLLLIAAVSSTCQAVMTVGTGSCADFTQARPSGQTALASNSSEISELFGTCLAELGVKIFNGPFSKDASVAGISSDYKAMPSVPAAFLLVIMGFLCISLVRDRKTWLAILVALIGLGQLSISALPKFAHKITDAAKSYDSSVLTTASNRMNLTTKKFRVRSNVEQTNYIGLLRKLSGIGDDNASYNINIYSHLIDLTNKVALSAENLSILASLEKLSPSLVQSNSIWLPFRASLAISYLPNAPPA